MPLRSPAHDTRLQWAAPVIHMYHSVGAVASGDPFQLIVKPERLAGQFEHLRRRGLRGVGVQTLLDAVDMGRAEGLVGLTFDDGYADFFECALPLLDEFGFQATVYVVTGLMSADNSWDEHPRLRLMSRKQVRLVRELGHEVGSHSMRHSRLDNQSRHFLEREITDSRAALQDIIGDAVTGFCYPYGANSKEARETVRASGYSYACTTRDYSAAGRFALPRIFIGQRDLHLRIRLKHLRHRVQSASGGWDA